MTPESYQRIKAERQELLSKIDLDTETGRDKFERAFQSVLRREGVREVTFYREFDSRNESDQAFNSR